MTNLIEKFEKRVFPEPNTGCWIYSTSEVKTGYSIVFNYIQGKNTSAHRYSFELYKGSIPEGLCVLHSCDNRWCVNPDHLRAGTHKENIWDMINKGRRPDGIQPKGEKNAWSKLTESQVLEIRRLRATGVKVSELHKQYPIVSRRTLDHIIARKKWKHI